MKPHLPFTWQSCSVTNNVFILFYSQEILTSNYLPGRLAILLQPGEIVTTVLHHQDQTWIGRQLLVFRKSYAIHG